MLAGGIRMYRHEDYEQLKLELPFGVTLREDNRWVLLGKLFPWEAIERKLSLIHIFRESGHNIVAYNRRRGSFFQLYQRTNAAGFGSGPFG